MANKKRPRPQSRIEEVRTDLMRKAVRRKKAVSCKTRWGWLHVTHTVTICPPMVTPDGLSAKPTMVQRPTRIGE